MRTDTGAAVRHHPAIIVGAGFSGLGAAIRLREEGIDDLLVLERGDDVGGTWRDNTYPGAACDIPSHLYSFSFEPKSDWTRAYPQQQEIQHYLQACARKHGIYDRARFGVEVTGARYDETTALWHVRTDDGVEYVTPILITAIGFLRDPAFPAIPGRESFAGPQMHTSRWDHDVELAGKRVAVVGTGASAIQVVPEIADVAARLTVFQRTPAWVIPRHDRGYTRLERTVFDRVPGARALNRLSIYLRKEARFVGFRGADNLGMRLMEQRSRLHLRTQVRDRDLRRRLTPDYRMGCKRVLISNDFYPALDRDHVDLVTDGIAEITPTGIVTSTGEHVEVDVIVYGTGFAVDDVLAALHVEGVGGQVLNEVWARRPRAYLGTTVPGFPNMFTLLGPNTGLGHNSMIFMIESQLNYVVDAVRQLRGPDVAAFDVRPEALDEFVDDVDERHGGLVWASGCESWYLGADGENHTLWPGFTLEYRWRTRQFDPTPYRVVARAALPAAAEVEPDDTLVTA